MLVVGPKAKVILSNMPKPSATIGSVAVWTHSLDFDQPAFICTVSCCFLNNAGQLVNFKDPYKSPWGDLSVCKVLYN